LMGVISDDASSSDEKELSLLFITIFCDKI
jgi:hypothetical protein